MARRQRSRLAKVSARQSRRQAVFYLLLSVGFVFVMIKWGLPFLINVIAGRSGDAPIENGYSIRPQSVQLAPVPEATYSGSLTFSGFAPTETTVILRRGGGSEIARDEVSSEGEFSFRSVDLSEGENQFVFIVEDAEGDVSDPKRVSVTRDTTKPSLEVSEPADDRQFYGEDQRRIKVAGTVSEDTERLTVNGRLTGVSDGTFDTTLSLNDGANEIVVAAEDAAGNVTQRLIRVFFEN